MTNSVFIGLHGPARIGKTTMLSYLEENYNICRVDPGDALKCFFTVTTSSTLLEILGELYLDYEDPYTVLKDTIQEISTSLLECYETNKKEGHLSRKATIGFAELFRSIYPDFWVKAAKDLFYEDSKVGIGGVINDGELRTIKQQYDTVFIIELNCHNPAGTKEKDSRTALSTHNNPTMKFTYDLMNSKEVAKSIVLQYNQLTDMNQLPLITLKKEKN